MKTPGDNTFIRLGSKECKNLVSYWLLGVGVEFGFWAILTAAHDLLSQEESSRNMNSTTRMCNNLSSGVILTAIIVPSITMKTLLPFLPLWIHARTIVIVITSVAGFALGAWKQTRVYIIAGVVLCSFSVGIGESSYLMYIPFFKDKKVVTAWSSGTGASGFLGSLTYLALISRGVSLSTTLHIMIAVPLLMGVVFWCLLEHPQIDTKTTPDSSKEQKDLDEISLRNRELNINMEILDHATTHDVTTLKEKLKILYNLFLSYTFPFYLIYVCQYTANQGLFELLHFRNNIIDLSSQVRWFNFVYFIAILISKSCGLLKVDYLWVMAFLQALNLTFFVTESIFGWMGNSSYSFWIVIVIIFWEGLLAGCSYINTYRRINCEMPVDHRQFSMSINSAGGSLGVLTAGSIAMSLHNFICYLPPR